MHRSVLKQEITIKLLLLLDPLLITISAVRISLTISMRTGNCDTDGIDNPNHNQLTS